MSEVFLSYAHEDRNRAKRLAHILEKQGWTVWWDRKILAGQTFDQVIEDELENAKCVVVLWSEHSVASEWCKTEAACASERGVLVPAVIDPVKLPLEFRRRQTADLVSWDEDPSHGGFQALCDGISAIITGNIPPPRATPPPRKVIKRRSWIFVALALILFTIGFGGYWSGFWKKEPPPKAPASDTSGYRKDIFKQLAKAQYEAVDMLSKDKAKAIRLIDKNLHGIDIALGSFPDDPDFHALKGYAAKDVYQSSKGMLSPEKRKEYLSIARKSFENALRLDPQNPSAHNGMGNVLLFEGNFDEAIKQHNLALKLTNGHYPAAEHDKKLVERVKRGEIPFDY
jgi:tetratricopeptide (TPR) repeat protein